MITKLLLTWLTLALLAGENQFIGNAWPMIADARRGKCDLPAMEIVAKGAPVNMSPPYRMIRGELELAIGFCHLHQTNNRALSQQWVDAARKTFGDDRPTDLTPAFASLLDDVAVGHDVRKNILNALVLSGATDAWLANLPLADGRLPGESYLVASPPYELGPGTSDPKLVHVGSPQDVQFSMGSDALRLLRLGPNVIAKLQPVAGSAKMTWKGVRLLTMQAPKLKKWVDESSPIQERLDRGQDPMIVSRAYEGQPSVVVKQGSLSVSAWSSLVDEIKRELDHRSGITASTTKDTLRIGLNGRHVLLYETMLASYVSKHLGGAPPSQNLQTVSQPLLMAKGDVTALVEQTVPWDLVTIAGGYYQNRQTLNQPWNADSARLVQRAMLPFAPRAIHELVATPQQPVGRSELEAFVARLRTAAKGARLLVVYVITHGSSVDGEDLELVLGDVAPKAAPGSPQPGMLKVGELHAQLRATGYPFVLLIDSCLPQPQLAAYRQELGFILNERTLQLDYAGNAPVITNELAKLGQRMRAFAAPAGQAYLRQSNPVVLGAKPGVYTPARSNPLDPMGPPVGPIAAKLWRTSTVTRLYGQPPRLLEAIKMAVDSKGALGEITPAGTISWSDFDGLEAALWPKAPNASATALLTVSGMKQAVAAGAQDLLLMTWLGPNDWSLGYWKRTMKAPKAFRTGLHVPEIAADANHVYVFDASSHEWSAHDIVDGVPRSQSTILKGVDSAGAASAESGELLVVAETGNVSTPDAVWTLKQGSFQSGGAVPGEDVEDLAVWGGSTVVALDSGTELMRVDGAQLHKVGNCGVLLSYLAPDTAALYGLSTDGKTMCRFDTNWAAQKLPLATLFSKPVPLHRAHSFFAHKDKIVVGIADTLWTIPKW